MLKWEHEVFHVSNSPCEFPVYATNHDHGMEGIRFHLSPSCVQDQITRNFTHRNDKSNTKGEGHRCTNFGGGRKLHFPDSCSRNPFTVPTRSSCSRLYIVAEQTGNGVSNSILSPCWFRHSWKHPGELKQVMQFVGKKPWKSATSAEIRSEINAIK